MRIVLLTSNRKGTAAYCLPILLANSDAEIVHVIYCERVKKKKLAHYRRKLKKIAKIGLLGAFNGIRMRKWFAVRSVDGKEITDIGETCSNNGIPFSVTAGINSAQTVEILQSSNPDLGLSLGNSYISSRIFTIPRYGMLNMHGEILPRFQNAQSVIWQLYEGSTKTGYTIHKVEKKIDTGEILLQESFPILFRDTLGETVNATCGEILKRSALGLAKVISSFEKYNYGSKAQGTGMTYTTPSYRQFLRIARNFRKLKAKEQ